MENETLLSKIEETHKNRFTINSCHTKLKYIYHFYIATIQKDCFKQNQATFVQFEVVST